jgi:hypothetical protein
MIYAFPAIHRGIEDALRDLGCTIQRGTPTLYRPA